MGQEWSRNEEEFGDFLIRIGLGDITVIVKHDLKIDFHYLMTHFLFLEKIPSAKCTYKWL